MLIIVGFTVLSLPSVQTELANKVSGYISKKTDYKITVDRLHIRWFDDALLHGVTVLDPEQNRMIYVPEIELDFDIMSLLENPVKLDKAVIQNPQVKLIKHANSNKLNMDVFIRTVRKVFNKKKKKKKWKAFTIAEIEIQDGVFSYDYERKPVSPDSTWFDHFHFGFHDIDMRVDNLYMCKDTFNINVKRLSCIEPKLKMPIHDLVAKMRMDNSKLEFSDIDWKLSNSKLNNYLKFEYDHVRQMSWINDSVNMIVRCDSTVLDVNDLTCIIPVLKQFDDFWTISGRYEGKMKKFKVNNFEGRLGQQSIVKGDFKLTGLPKVLDTEIRTDFDSTKLFLSDLKQYLPAKYYKAFDPFQYLRLKAKFDGFPKDFVAYGDFHSGLGHFDSDLRFEIKEDESKSHYSGHLNTDGFDIGTFLNRKYLGNIQMNGFMKGSGFSVEDANIEMDATVARLGVMDYTYKNMVVDANLSNSYFNGELKVNDENLLLHSKGKVDLRKGKNIFEINTEIGKANLQALKITKDTAYIRTRSDLKFKGLTLDEIIGKGRLTDSKVLYNGRSLAMKDFYFESFKKNDIRNFKLLSSYGDVKFDGNFEFKDLYKDALALVKEYKLLLQNDKKAQDKYYSKKHLSEDSYAMDYTLKLKSINELLNIFAPSFSIIRNTEINGSFRKDESMHFTMKCSPKSFRYKRFTLEDNELSVSLSKLKDNSEALASIMLSTKEFKSRGKPRVENIRIHSVLDKNNLAFTSKMHQYKQANNANISGNLTFYTDSSLLHLDQSNFNIVNKNWKVSDDNLVRITKKGREIEFFNFIMDTDSHSVKVQGAVSDDPNRKLAFSVKDINLEHIHSLIKTPVKGTLNGSVSLYNLWDHPITEMDFLIDRFDLYGLKLDSINALVTNQENKDKFDINGRAWDGSTEIGFVSGHYDQSSIAPINLECRLNDTRLNMLEPLMLGEATNFNGKVNGKITVTGKSESPDLNGALFINDGSFKITYLNVPFFFDDSVFFDQKKVFVRKLEVRDSIKEYDQDVIGHSAIVDGGFSHKFFTKFKFDVDMNLDRCLLLHTDEKDNELFYGTGIGSGDMHIGGTLNRVLLKSKELRSHKGTYITIPTYGESEVTNKSFIRYIPANSDATVSDSTKKNSDTEGEKKESNSSVYADLNFNVTKDAAFTILYDEEVFNIKKGQGTLNLGADTRDDVLTLRGSYEILEGNYNFKFANIIDKEFKAIPGGRISWQGDPYDGKVNLTASYLQRTALKPILDSSVVDINSPEAKRPYPVYVLMNLKGNVLNPEIAFDIDFRDYPRNLQSKAGSYISTDNFLAKFKTRIRNDEQELNRQVFSLMVLQQLSPENSFQAGNVAGNATELIANQFSAWLSQVDENVEVDIDLNSFDEDALQTLRLRLSVQALDGKIRITRDGGFTNVDNTANLSSIMGEVTVEYLITDDGKFRLKAYNKTNQNTISTSIQNNNNLLYGASLLYTESFNNLNELIKKRKDRKKRKAQKLGEMKKEEELETPKEE